MPDETYRIIYEGVPDKAHKAIDALIAKHKQLDAQIATTNAKLRTVGADTSGITKFMSGAAKLATALKGIVGGANSAEKELKDVGKGNNSVANLTKRLAALEAQLKAVTAAGNAAAPAVAGVGKGAGGGGGGGGRAAGGSGAAVLARGVGTHLAYSAFRTMARAPAAMAADRREFYGKAADMASDYRKDLTELAVLQGKVAPDDDLMREDLAFQKKTLLNPEASRTFRLEFGGAVAPALDARGPDGAPNITPETAKQLEVEAARFTARYGLDPTTGGRLSGLLGKTQKVPTAAAGLSTLAETMEQLNIKGVGPVRQLAPQLLTLSGGMLDQVNDDSEDGEKGGGGRFKSFPEMAARFAATTASQAGSGARAKTRIVQSDRLLRKLAHDRTSILGQRANITPEDDYEAAIRKLAPHIAGPRGDKALIDSGYKNSTERLAVIEAAKNNAIVDANMEQARKSHKTLNPIADNAAYAGSQAGRQQGAENDEFAAMIEGGMAGERLKAARTRARAAMIREGTLKPGGLFQFGTDKVRSLFESYGGVSGEDLNVDERAVNDLRKEARKYGVDVDGKYPGLNQGGYAGKNNGFRVGSTAGTDEAAFQKQYAAAADEVEQARKLRQAGRLLIDAANGMGSGGGNGRQAPPPPGNGGAGVNPGRR